MVKVLFVCLGNICRSPAAEGVFRKMVEEAGLSGSFEIASAGTSDYHVGDPPDARMQAAARDRGYQLNSRGQQFDPKAHFEEFHYILAMDQANFVSLRNEDLQDRFKSKVHLFTSFCKVHEVDHVPDPYHGGADGFELVMDIIEDGCGGLLRHIQAKDLGR